MSIKGALSVIPNKIQGMLKDYVEDLEQAWTNAGEEPLTISFSAKIGIQKGTSKNICEVSISFTKEKVKDSKTFYWDPNQGELFKTIERIDDRLKKDGTSMTISSPGGESVTLGKKEADLPDLDEDGYMNPRQHLAKE
jgi:hypothetical protein